MHARLVALAALASSTAASAAPEAALQPTGKWVVNFADAQCVASRDYGALASPLVLVFKKPAIGDVLQIAVVQNGAMREPEQTDGEIAFDERTPIETSFLDYGVKKLKKRALMINLQTIDLGAMRQASTIRIHSRVKSKQGNRPATPTPYTDLTFAISEMPTVLTLLDECADDLQKVWNVWDENRDSVTLKKGPSGQIQNLFSGSDYPLVAVRNDLSGTTTLVMLIDEFGKVADCTVTQTSGAASIDAQSCAIIRERGKFKPAIGLDGKPTKSSWRQSITWRLES